MNYITQHIQYPNRFLFFSPSPCPLRAIMKIFQIFKADGITRLQGFFGLLAALSVGLMAGFFREKTIWNLPGIAIAFVVILISLSAFVDMMVDTPIVSTRRVAWKTVAIFYLQGGVVVIIGILRSDLSTWQPIAAWSAFVFGGISLFLFLTYKKIFRYFVSEMLAAKASRETLKYLYDLELGGFPCESRHDIRKVLEALKHLESIGKDEEEGGKDKEKGAGNLTTVVVQPAAS